MALVHDWFMLLLGLALVALGVMFWRRDQRLRAVGATAEGTVTDLRRGTRGGTAPVVSFRTAAGQPVVWPSGLYSAVVSYRVGQRVRVLYDPAAPENAALEGSVLWRAAPLIPVILGMVLAHAGIVGR